jgi:hypothetical protein
LKVRAAGVTETLGRAATVSVTGMDSGLPAAPGEVIETVPT